LPASLLRGYVFTVGDLNFENHAAILSELGWDNNGRDGTEEGKKRRALNFELKGVAIRLI